HNDEKASFSNWGATSVDLAAPGVNILSCKLNGSYGTASGTSMACPHVAGVCALLKGLDPSISYTDLKARLMEAVDPIAAMEGKCITGGRLNAFKTVLFGAGPYCVLKSHSIDDDSSGGTSGNGDSLFNPGETIGLDTVLLNVGSEDAIGVDGTLALASADSYVTVTQAAVSYGDIVSRAEGAGASQYLIQAAADCPTPHEVPLVLTMTDDNANTWTANITLWVYTSSQISGNVLLDGSPLEGAVISFAGPISGSVLTNASGDYLFGGIDGTYTVIAGKGDYLDSAPVNVTVPGSKTGIDFAFTTATISGVATDALTGNPVQGASVDYAGGLSGAAATAADGTYDITRVFGREDTLTLVCTHASYFDSAPVDITLPPDSSGVNFQMGTADIRISPASFDVTTDLGNIETRTLTISNVGGGGLEWSIWNQLGGGLDSLAEGDVLRQFTLPTEAGNPYGAAFDGSVLWIARYSNMLYKVDPNSGSLLGTLDVSGLTSAAWGLGWDGTNLWMTDYNGGKLFAVDRTNGSAIKTFDAPGSKQPTSIAPGGGSLWVSDYTDRKFYEVDPADGSVLGEIAHPTVQGTIYGVAYFNGGLWLSSYYGDGMVYKVSCADGSVMKSFQGPETSVLGTATDGDGGLWLCGYSSRIAYLVDTGEVTWLSEEPKSGTVPGLSSQEVTVSFDSESAKPGVHTAIIHVSSNDPDASDVTASVTFTVTTPYTVSGNVTKDGSALAGATIEFSGPHDGSVQTDGSGDYSFYAGEGVYTLVAKVDGYLETAPVDVTVPPSRTGIDFAFTTATVSGVVTDADTGAPVDAATVDYTGGLEGSATTAADGTYSFTRVFGQTDMLTLVARKPGVYFNSVPANATIPPDATNVNMELGVSDIDVAPASFDVSANMGEAPTRTLTISNTGTQDLVWSVWNQMDSGAGSLAAGDVKRQFNIPSEAGSPYGAA
ncbi:S8 family serine peptidase, partial [Planctomycetota bacterium]